MIVELSLSWGLDKVNKSLKRGRVIELFPCLNKEAFINLMRKQAQGISKFYCFRYYVKPTMLRMNKRYIIYYSTWAWVLFTGKNRGK